MLVATAIFAVVVTAAFLMFESGRRVTEAGEDHASVFQAARAALAEIERDVRGAWASGSAYDSGLIGKDGGTSDLPLDEIELIAVNQDPYAVEDLAMDVSRVRYFVAEEAADPPGLSRRRVRVLHQAVVSAQEGESEEVAREVVGFDLRYFDGEWKENWDSTKSRTLPKVVEATVFVKGKKERRERFTARFTLPLWRNVPESGQ